MYMTWHTCIICVSSNKCRVSFMCHCCVCERQTYLLTLCLVTVFEDTHMILSLTDTTMTCIICVSSNKCRVSYHFCVCHCCVCERQTQQDTVYTTFIGRYTYDTCMLCHVHHSNKWYAAWFTLLTHVCHMCLIWGTWFIVCHGYHSSEWYMYVTYHIWHTWVCNVNHGMIHITHSCVSYVFDMGDVIHCM